MEKTAKGTLARSSRSRKDATKLAVFRYHRDYFGMGKKLRFRDDLKSQITSHEVP
jgi:hypothetical protein